MIPDAVIEEIRSRIDIVAVLGRHMELKKAGRTWKGCCVFHGERTPSFHVYPEDKHWKCYGCGEYGDVFKFLQKLQGKEFPEVVRALAADVGVEIPEREEDSAEQRQRRKERTEVLAACDAAARYYAARLWSRYGEPARAYLDGRGIAEETSRRFRLGVAADAWNDLPPRMKEKGVGEAALLKAGLLVPREGKRPYDRFRGRLLFPIAGLDGEVIGFGARVLPGGDEKGAKYVNSPESPVYKKSKVLYGLDLAREAIRRTRSAVLVEGYFDVIGLHQVGVKNAVAVCGTALTPEHLELLSRCDCREVTLIFDGDVAGLAAPARAAQALLPSGIAGKVAVLPSEKGKTDPDEFARQNGLSAVEALVAAAPPLTEFLIDRAVEKHCGGDGPGAPVERKVAAFRELRPFLALAQAGIARAAFEERVARRLGVDLAALQAELSAPEARQRGRPSPAPAQPQAQRPAVRLRLQGMGGPAIDALGLLAVWPTELGPIAEEEGLVNVLPPGPVADAARMFLRGELDPAGLVARLETALDSASLGRLKQLALGPAAPRKELAVREMRRAILMAKKEDLEAQMDRVLKATTRAGSPAPEELATEQGVLAARMSDLQKRLRALERT
ncbi:MAG: DNA primase [Deltaproteobacteria bacterium]|nr:DNA primase [Deltaproteobacteria bacterium]